MDSWKMDQRINIQQQIRTKNSVGDSVSTWEDVAMVWAEVIPLRGAALFAAEQEQHKVDVRFRIRERAGLDESMRIIWRNQPYDITGIIPGTAQYRNTLEIMAANGVRDGR